jgi:flagellar hook-associated protein 3 FlgL
MELSYISTKALNEGNRLSVLKLQQRLAVAQKEVSSGRLADVGQSLGARTSETVSLRQDLSRLNMITDTNAVVSSRLQVSQEALRGISGTAEAFIGTLIGSRNAETGPLVAKNSAKAGLIGLTDGLNTTFGGEYLFGGINTNQPPLTNYFGEPTQANRQAVITAFQAEFGFAPDDPQVASIVPSQMQTFIDTTLSAMFEEPAWSANWSAASDENIDSRVSVSEVIETSANANDAAFRKLAMAYTMMSDLGVENMTPETYAVVVDSAITFAGEAVQDTAVVQANLGVAQERVAKANAKMDAQIDILTNRINGLESVDPFDAAVRVTSLMTQIETSYALTARIQNMTILNYLR